MAGLTAWTQLQEDGGFRYEFGWGEAATESYTGRWEFDCTEPRFGKVISSLHVGSLIAQVLVGR